MTVRELIERLQSYSEESIVFIPGSGSADGNWVELQSVETKTLTPSKFIHNYYGKAVKDIYEFEVSCPDKRWVAKHGINGVLLE